MSNKQKSSFGFHVIGSRPLYDRFSALSSQDTSKDKLLKRIGMALALAVAAGMVYEYSGTAHEDQAVVVGHHSTLGPVVDLVLLTGPRKGAEADMRIPRLTWPEVGTGQHALVRWREGRITGQAHVTSVIEPLPASAAPRGPGH